MTEHTKDSSLGKKTYLAREKGNALQGFRRDALQTFGLLRC